MPKLEIENLMLNKFPELIDVRLHDFIYKKADSEFYANFLVGIKADEEEKKAAEEYLSKILEQKTTVKLTPAYIDEDYIRTRVARFFAKDGGYLKPALERLDYDVKKLSDKEYQLIFYGSANFCGYMEGALKENLLNYLYRSFLEKFDVLTVEVNSEKKVDKEIKQELRAVEVAEREAYIGKPVTESPGFICDIKGEYDNAIIAGKVTNLVERTKKNPPPANARNKNPKFFTFNVTDPSGSFPCVMFPSIANTEAANAMENMEAVFSGKIARDKFGEIKMTVNTVTKCKIITSAPPKSDLIKDEPVYYTTVSPSPLVVYEQANALEEKKQLDLSKLFGKTIVVFDLETTGLDREKSRIIELGAVKIVDGEFTEKFQTFINPEMPIPKDASKKNNITDEMVKDAPLLADVLPDFYKFSFGAILCGHNAADFDVPILNNQSKKYGYKFTNPLIDTYPLAVRYVKGARNNKLESLCLRFGIVNENAHRAYEDAISTARVLMNILNEYKEVNI